MIVPFSRYCKPEQFIRPLSLYLGSIGSPVVLFQNLVIMDKYTGIDVSKATLDVAFCDNNGNWQWEQFTNNQKGFKQILKFSPTDNVVVMEASGPYYVQLAMYLHSQDRTACVVNPLQVRRFSQMKFYRAKTDRKDARTIAEYGQSEHPSAWQPSDQVILQMQQIITCLEGLIKQIQMSSRQTEAFQSSGIMDSQVMQSLKQVMTNLNKQRAKLESRLAQLATSHYGETMNLLQTIPGIGPKTAAILTIISNNFEKFDNYKQLIAYVGFSPRIFQSGSSIRGKGHICKMGKSQVRKLLYMCTWTAKTCNKGCNEMYERLKAKGKPERVIKIAIANKLLKQAFAVVTKKQPYDKNYQSKICF